LLERLQVCCQCVTVDECGAGMLQSELTTSHP
jgi:hypothetical protein